MALNALTDSFCHNQKKCKTGRVKGWTVQRYSTFYVSSRIRGGEQTNINYIR